MPAHLHGVLISRDALPSAIGSERYFAKDELIADVLRKNGRRFYCDGKGYADRYDLVSEGVMIPDAAWAYEHPYDDAKEIAGRIGVQARDLVVS